MIACRPVANKYLDYAYGFQGVPEENIGDGKMG
jgi:hypothetical protein